MLDTLRSAIRGRIARWWWPAIPQDWLSEGGTVVCHDWLTAAAGSDKVAAHLVRTVEAEALVCFAASPQIVDQLGIQVPVYESRLGPWAARGRRWQVLLPLMPLAWSALDLRGAEAVVTSSHSAVNAVRTPHARRLSYCHTPMRYAWDWRLERRRMPPIFRPLLPAVAAVFRQLDRRWSRRVDTYIANSSFVAERIRRYYGRDAVVIHPPIDTEWFTPGIGPRNDEYLHAGRLVPYKRADLAVEAAVRARQPLVIAGSGPELERLRALADEHVRFVHDPSDDELRELFRSCKAFLYLGVEDFGMTLVEAQACGAPVIARAEGGALDSVDPAVSGVLVDSESVEDWARVLTAFRDTADSESRVRHASAFSPHVFEARIRKTFDESRHEPDGQPKSAD